MCVAHLTQIPAVADCDQRSSRAGGRLPPEARVGEQGAKLAETMGTRRPWRPAIETGVGLDASLGLNKHCDAP